MAESRYNYWQTKREFFQTHASSGDLDRYEEYLAELEKFLNCEFPNLDLPADATLRFLEAKYAKDKVKAFVATKDQILELLSKVQHTSPAIYRQLLVGFRDDESFTDDKAARVYYLAPKEPRILSFLQSQYRELSPIARKKAMLMATDKLSLLRKPKNQFDKP